MASPLEMLGAGANALGQGVGAVVGLPFQFLGGLLGQQPGNQSGWKHPDRQALAMSYIPEALSDADKAQRMETFRLVPINNWPMLIRQFQKTDLDAAKIHASPEAQELYSMGGAQLWQQRYPGVPLPTARPITVKDYPPLDDLDRAIADAGNLDRLPLPFPIQAQGAPMFPPAAPSDQLAHEKAQRGLGYLRSDERAARTITGAGPTPEMEGDTAYATALGTRQAQEPFDIRAEQRASGTRMREAQAKSDIDEARTKREKLAPTDASRSQAQLVLNESAGLEAIANEFLANLRPENVGFVAKLRKATFGAAAQTDAIGQALATNRDQVLDDIAQNNAKEGTEVGVDPAAFFDPALSTIEMLGNVLAYRHARILDPTGKLSDADVANSKKSLGLDNWLASDADIRKRVELVREFATKSATQAQKTLSTQAPGPTRSSGPLDLGDGFTLEFE